MTEQELREKIKNVLSDNMRWQPYYAIMRGIVYEQDLDNLADALIAEGLRFRDKHRIFVENAPIPTTCVDNTFYLVPNTPPTIKQLYGDEEVEQIVKERDEYKQRAELMETALRVLARKFVIFAFPNGDWKELIEQLVSEIKEQAEKELAEGNGGKKEV